jgi:UDP-N-acetylglucosamine--N-acetylmuramyl-(pentapeptide) pyrophosphoryl-undecaprenol N-acetylglucosamine transferase
VRGRRGTVIAGGGTGGHVVPSLQIARALVALGQAPDSIELFGSRRGQEATVWPALEFPFTLLPGRGIRRSLRPTALWANAGALLGLLWATVRSIGSFAARRPRVVVVVGGYAGFPAGVAAVLTRVPVVLMNTDAVPGAVNGLLGRFAAASAVAFPGTDLPRAHVTGTPVRPELGSLDRTPTGRREARTMLGLPAGRVTLGAFGGSLGARRINGAVAELADRWADRAELSVYHVAGRRDFERFAVPAASNGGAGDGDAGDVDAGDGVGPGGGTGTGLGSESGLRSESGLHYEVVPYEERMPELYRAVDLCVCRAGAMTVAELLMAGVPAILIPLPGAPRDHQTRNAEAMVAAGAAILIPDAECSAERLATELESLLPDADRLTAMSAAARAFGHPDAAVRVAELVTAHAR